MDNQKKLEWTEPIEFWTEAFITLDQKISFIKKHYGFGKVTMQVVVRDGIIYKTVYMDEVENRRISAKKSP